MNPTPEEYAKRQEYYDNKMATGDKQTFLNLLDELVEKKKGDNTGNALRNGTGLVLNMRARSTRRPKAKPMKKGRASRRYSGSRR